ncbi:MAG: UDP-N-acetylmuramate-L-alanine ligase [Candidatus Nomurabacteria bacterium GW2011_GWF2_35_66]|uniref:UDP-N-acetylmuramate--L-alanine ligase n=1 Tax=Candidatus Nomurabacteria bacterium GW2011_GWE1_35_16 TaxID=1618761 RepID=A0A0G0BRJ1_9BACT|nr:MAG: UDP-N-acetylmuramate-L-alanine ligase [Candidatus Nomurabacteria bacterium GW2011_GWF1_34_20]KKP62862.1 MAG: UDP-N-acetylmuramate-L-alanine ligase [Candidatus Nomurabacteria bacterium GW2011_GWE2_34_25]KKP66261.1 MAG: UDP-N-acetylmuramate-L-alanine ligase [Candidatus Nomurabacteria bacterium GW2011_GWE1_35_16]KKP83093.1 MAG: UDP-N-acetylmuramate-L-alanine ligase [Candidatus Nomurabacteria bacterium GW2011_GWF2_35_66]HAE36688.1 UDP-N-acetylmuramate--L-alanine ligase [Candidatus Nomurabac
MQDLDLSKINNVHFIGIGGIGVSAVARMMKAMGKNVTGQDMQDGEIVEELKKLDIDIKVGHQSYEAIPEDTDLVVYTVAIETYDKELFDKIKNKEVGLPYLSYVKKFIAKSYPEMLGIISKDKYTIAVCGTHGKTTTTGMLAQIFKDASLDPTVIVGSLLKDKEGNRTNFIGGTPNRADGQEYFIVEACEYRRSFLKINPNILVITNIDEDHLDYYKDIEDIKSAFHEMAMKVPSDGFIVCNVNDDNIKDVVKDINARVIDWQDYFDANLKLKIPGVHNKKNAAASIATGEICGIEKENGRKYIAEFSGTWRRFEFKGELPNGVLVYDDYAHHPKEITSTLEGFRELYKKEDNWKITVIFQPHLFSRTKLLLNDFAQSFKDADQVMLLPIYYAREVDDGSISSEILELEINKYTDNAEAFPDFKSLEKNLFIRLENMDDKNIVVTMGAGEAFKIGETILK